MSSLHETTEALLRAVRDWSNNDNPGAPEIIEALGPWVRTQRSDEEE